MKLHQNSKCTNVVFITDIHMDNHPQSVVYSRMNRLDKAVSAVKKLSNEFKIHACVFGGDYIFDSGSAHDRSYAQSVLQRVNT